jgi:nicotinamide-nucleotide amidase
MSHLIGLLATGDEVQNGDILNTNAQRIANLLSDAQFQIGEHMVAGDEHATMVRALQYLLKHHQAIIITGGLGPTSDDRTRFALAEVLGCDLVFFDHVWDAVVARMHSLGLTVPENNRQQALFPSDAIIIPNNAGTAAGCKVTFGDRIIYMLPGQPSECMPMMHQMVLPDLQLQGWQGKEVSRYWRLYGVSESHIASWIEPLLADQPCRLGYRLDFPYLELKLFTQTEAELTRIAALLEPKLSEHYLVDSYIPASTKLKQRLAQADSPKLILRDNATRGMLTQILSSPETAAHLDLIGETQDSAAVEVILTGLDSYWQQLKDATITELVLSVRHGDKHSTERYPLPYRYQRTVHYATEYAAAKILDWL